MQEKEVDAVLKSFGHQAHQQSTLFDEFERLSFEIQLNQTILRRSLSEPARGWTVSGPAVAPPTVAALVSREEKHGAGRTKRRPFQHALRKLLRPFFVIRRKEKSSNREAPTIGNYGLRRFSRSIRV